MWFKIIWKNFHDFWKNGQFLSKFDDFGEIYENSQNALQMGGWEAKNDAQNLRPAE